MSSPPAQLPASDTLPDLLLTLTALTGEFPVSQVERLPGSDSYKALTVKRLKKSRLLRGYYRDGLRGLRLTATAKKILLEDSPDRFTPFLTGNAETNTPKSEVTRRLRLYRMAEVLITMNNAGVSVFPWEKADVFSPGYSGEPVICPCYYTSRELKEIGPQGTKIRGSRATGVLLVDGGFFAVYNTASSEMKWEYQAELRLKALLQIELCQRRLPRQFQNARQEAIVFGTGMGQMEVLMGADGRIGHNYFVLDGSYEHFYYLTNDHHGEVILQLLCEDELKQALDDILMENLTASRPGWPVENDAFDEADSPVLFGYTCDMPRIKRFDTALSLHEQHGVLICFDFQEEALRRICGQRVALQSIDFDAFERSVSYFPQATD